MYFSVSSQTFLSSDFMPYFSSWTTFFFFLIYFCIILSPFSDLFIQSNSSCTIGTLDIGKFPLPWHLNGMTWPDSYLLNYRPCSAVLQVINETEKKPNVNIIFILYGIFFFLCMNSWRIKNFISGNLQSALKYICE